MLIQEFERGYLPTSTKSAEIPIPQTSVESFINTPTRIEMVSGLGKDSVLTEETGFPLWLEMNRFYNDLNFALSSGRNLIESLRITTNELVVNIRDYEVEFIKSKTVIPHLNRFDVVDGVQRMVGNNGRPVVDAISSQERNGSVLEAAGIVESFLLSADPHSCGVTMSPSGWSGYELCHKNAQVVVSWKYQEGVIKGLTFVTDLSEEQARQVMISLGVSEDKLKGENEQKRLANIVRNPALLAFPRSDINPFEYVFDKILAIRGRGDTKLLQKDGSVEQRSVEQTKVDIKRFDELLIFEQEEEECIAELREFIIGRAFLLGDRNTQERVVKKIESTVLKLAREHLRKNDTTWKGLPYGYRASVVPVKAEIHLLERSDNFAPELAYLKSRGGCSTGAARALGGVSLGIESGGTKMPSTVTFSDLKDRDFCIKCGACGKEINCVVKKGEHCPKCRAIREC